MSIPILESYPIDLVGSNFDNKPEWEIEDHRSALLIHDMQSYFTGFYGVNSPIINHLTNNIRRLKKECKSRGIPSVYTTQPGNQSQENRALLTDFWGQGLEDKPKFTGILPELAPDENDCIFTKWRYSAFKKNNFLDWLKENKKDQIIICGIYAHIGILSTALDAFMLDVQPFVVSDAVADFSLSDHQMAMSYISKRCGVVTNMDSILNCVNPPNYMEIKVRKDIAGILSIEPDEFGSVDNLADFGLDSIRTMTLIGKWQNEAAWYLGWPEYVSRKR